MSRYRVARLSEIPSLPTDLVDSEWKPLRHHLGIRAFGTNAFVARAAGEIVVEEHAETDAEELYFVAAGRARFTLDGEVFDAPAGTLVFCGDPSIVRGAVAEEPGTAVLAVGAVPGTPFAVSEWERRRTPG